MQMPPDHIPHTRALAADLNYNDIVWYQNQPCLVAWGNTPPRKTLVSLFDARRTWSITSGTRVYVKIGHLQPTLDYPAPSPEEAST